MRLPQLTSSAPIQRFVRVSSVLILAFGLLATTAPAGAATTEDAIEDCLLERINEERAASGLIQLRMATEMNPDVRAHSAWMSDNTFQHMSDSERLAILPTNVTTYAENIVFSGDPNPVDCSIVHSIIMDSSPHRANVLNADMRFLAVGAHIDSQGVWATELFFDAPGYSPDFNGTFWDDDGSPFEAEIEVLAATGITSGCSAEMFCPNGSVTREQMAAFLVRALDLPDAPSAGFTDTIGNVFAKDIDRLAAAGVTKGCSTHEFCPSLPVTRGQMAAFLVRALDLPDAPSAGFTDTANSVFANDIDRLAASAVTLGCGENLYCPNDPITREQMAAFLVRSLGL